MGGQQHFGAGIRQSQAELSLQDAVLRSPIDGVILRRSVEVGSLAGPSAPAFTVADTPSTASDPSSGIPSAIPSALSCRFSSGPSSGPLRPRVFASAGSTSETSPWA